MWRNSPHGKFFSTSLASEASDKYEVWSHIMGNEAFCVKWRPFQQFGPLWKHWFWIKVNNTISRWISALEYTPYPCLRTAICSQVFRTQHERDVHVMNCFWFCNVPGCSKGLGGEGLSKKRAIEQHKSFHRTRDAKKARLMDELGA